MSSYYELKELINDTNLLINKTIMIIQNQINNELTSKNKKDPKDKKIDVSKLFNINSTIYSSQNYINIECLNLINLLKKIKRKEQEISNKEDLNKYLNKLNVMTNKISEHLNIINSSFKEFPLFENISEIKPVFIALDKAKIKITNLIKKFKSEIKIDESSNKKPKKEFIIKDDKPDTLFGNAEDSKKEFGNTDEKNGGDDEKNGGDDGKSLRQIGKYLTTGNSEISVDNTVLSFLGGIEENDKNLGPDDNKIGSSINVVGYNKNYKLKCGGNTDYYYADKAYNIKHNATYGGYVDSQLFNSLAYAGANEINSDNINEKASSFFAGEDRKMANGGKYPGLKLNKQIPKDGGTNPKNEYQSSDESDDESDDEKDGGLPLNEEILERLRKQKEKIEQDKRNISEKLIKDDENNIIERDDNIINEFDEQEQAREREREREIQMEKERERMIEESREKEIRERESEEEARERERESEEEEARERERESEEEEARERETREKEARERERKEEEAREEERNKFLREKTENERLREKLKIEKEEREKFEKEKESWEKETREREKKEKEDREKKDETKKIEELEKRLNKEFAKRYGIILDPIIIQTKKSYEPHYSDYIIHLKDKMNLDYPFYLQFFEFKLTFKSLFRMNKDLFTKAKYKKMFSKTNKLSNAFIKQNDLFSSHNSGFLKNLEVEIKDETYKKVLNRSNTIFKLIDNITYFIDLNHNLKLVILFDKINKIITKSSSDHKKKSKKITTELINKRNKLEFINNVRRNLYDDLSLMRINAGKLKDINQNLIYLDQLKVDYLTKTDINIQQYKNRFNVNTLGSNVSDYEFEQKFKNELNDLSTYLFKYELTLKDIMKKIEYIYIDLAKNLSRITISLISITSEEKFKDIETFLEIYIPSYIFDTVEMNSINSQIIKQLPPNVDDNKKELEILTKKITAKTNLKKVKEALNLITIV